MIEAMPKSPRPAHRPGPLTAATVAVGVTQVMASVTPSPMPLTPMQAFVRTLQYQSGICRLWRASLVYGPLGL